MKNINYEKLNNYIKFLNEIMTLINNNIKTIDESHSIDIKKYYFKEINNFKIIKNNENINLLKKSFEIKKRFLRISKISKNLLKDIILYSNRYNINETEFFDKMEPVSKISNNNFQIISNNLYQNNYFINLTIEDKNKIYEMFDIYKEANKIYINIKDYKNFLINNNLYKNIKTIKRNLKY